MGALEVIDKLRKRGYEIVFCSSRNENQMKKSYERTAAWFEKNNIHFDKLVVKTKYKRPIEAEEKAGFFIGDFVGQTTFVADNCCVDVISLAKGHVQHDKVNVIGDWNEICNYIKNKEKSLNLK